MLDTHIHKHAAPYPQTILEQRAPTDDSIRIYDEIRTKAMEVHS
jgi:hypothetical protein